MKYLLTITEVPNGCTLNLPPAFLVHPGIPAPPASLDEPGKIVALPPGPVERLRMTVDELSPATLQEIIALLHRTPRKPRKDKGQPRQRAESQQTLPGT